MDAFQNCSSFRLAKKELLIRVEMATWKTMEHMEFMSPENKHLRVASPEEAFLEWLELPLC